VKPNYIKSKKAFIEFLIASYIYENQYYKLDEFKKCLEVMPG
jgi:hypothetical protein